MDGAGVLSQSAISQKGRGVMEYKSLAEAIESIGYGMCSIRQAEHEFPDIKCDLILEGKGK